MRSTTIIREWTDPENSMDPGLTGRSDASAGSRLTGDLGVRETPPSSPTTTEPSGFAPMAGRREDSVAMTIEYRHSKQQRRPTGPSSRPAAAWFARSAGVLTQF
jgi:hypothetical protein